MLNFHLQTNGNGGENSDSTHANNHSSAIMDMIVAKLRKQRSSLVEKDTQYVKYEQIAHSLEAASACFVCGQCLQFSTWDSKQLIDHVTTEHSTSKSVCPYCLTLTPVAEIGDHQLRHFAASTALDLYPCPHCPSYLEDKTAFLNHCQEAHGATRGGGQCVCGCCKTTFANVAQLAGHIEESVRPLYQCEVPGCLVKSASKLAVQRHLAKRHPSQPATAIASADYLACASRPIALLDLPQQPQQQQQQPHQVPGRQQQQQQTPPIVYSLRCPNCPFSTVSWAKFARHLSGADAAAATRCRGGSAPKREMEGEVADTSAAAAHGETCRIWYCSECGACATDSGLILEHMACSHGDNSEAILLEEEIGLSQIAAKPADEDDQQQQQQQQLLEPPPQRHQQHQHQHQKSQHQHQHQHLNQSILAQTLLDRKRPLDVSAGSDAAVNLSAHQGAAKFARLDDATLSASLSSEQQQQQQQQQTGEYVSFPFHEEAYRASMPANSPQADVIVAKMKLFCRYQVRILGRENQRRIPECPECKRAFPYGLGDFKRHLLSVHLGIPRDTVREVLRFTQPAPGSGPGGASAVSGGAPSAAGRLAAAGSAATSKGSGTVGPNYGGLPRPLRLDAHRQRVSLPFSTAVLRRLTQHFSRESQDYLIGKMATYSTLHVIVDAKNGKKYLCGHCNYASPHALADVRKHILGSHCGISTKHFRYCLQASRLDPVEYGLLSDEKLFRLAKDFVRTRRSSPPPQSLTLSRRQDAPTATGRSLIADLSAPASSAALAARLLQHRAGGLGDGGEEASLDPEAAAVLELPPPFRDGNNSSSPSNHNNNSAGGDSDCGGGKGAIGGGLGGLHFGGQNASHFEEADGVDEEEVRENHI